MLELNDHMCTRNVLYGIIDERFMSKLLCVDLDLDHV